MATSIVKFFDRALRPPRGGWHYNISGQLIEKFSESDILEMLRNWRSNNGTFAGEEALERELWDYYCGREPERCGGKAQPTGWKPITGAAREQTPEVVGPPLWETLNRFGVSWEPGTHTAFLVYAQMMTVLIGCPICANEWQAILKSNPPNALQSRGEVCQWINAMHNQVNAKLGKPQYPYERMVLDYGAPSL